MAWLWEHLGERYRELPGPWWAVFGIYETLLVGAWTLEYALLNRVRALSGDPTGARVRDRGYVPWWCLHFLLLQFPLYRTGRWSTILPQTWACVAAGTGIALLGIAIRLSAIATLREYFSYVVHVGRRQPLVTHGLYRYVRHPAYLGLVVLFLGVPISVCDSWSVLLAMVYVAGFLWLRIRKEERALAETFGEDYRAWRARTKLLIPFVL